MEWSIAYQSNIANAEGLRVIPDVTGSPGCLLVCVGLCGYAHAKMSHPTRVPLSSLHCELWICALRDSIKQIFMVDWPLAKLLPVANIPFGLFHRRLRQMRICWKAIPSEYSVKIITYILRDNSTNLLTDGNWACTEICGKLYSLYPFRKMPITRIQEVIDSTDY